jgi:DNA-binding CsgD family transcriptional regulator
MFCQSDNSLKEIDKLLKKAETSNRKYEDLKELEYAKKANTLAEKAGDSKRMAKSYLFMSRSLFNLDLQKESLLYAQKASAQEATKEDIVLQALLTEVKAYNYNYLGLSTQYIKELGGILKLLEKKNDPTSIEIKSRIYANLAIYHKDNNNLDSTFTYFRLQEKQLKKLPEKKYFSALCEHYSFVGAAFLEKKNTDSSFFYFKKSYALKKKYKDPVLYMQYVYFGDYYESQNQYKKALDLYLKAIKNIQQYSGKSSYLIFTYDKISSVYGILKEKDKQEEYKNLSVQLKNKMLVRQRQMVDYAINVILNDKKNEYTTTQRRNYIFISISVSVLIISFFLMYNFLRKNIKNKENIITEVTGSLQHKDELISKKSIETKGLQQKINEAYNEVIELAKDNRPAFYFRFQEVYPEFQQKLLEMDPTLRISELTICAYIFLGFNNKDIARYTFKSPNTIRNRKHILRKKLNIPTEEDMGIWLRNNSIRDIMNT